MPNPSSNVISSEAFSDAIYLKPYNTLSSVVSHLILIYCQSHLYKPWSMKVDTSLQLRICCNIDIKAHNMYVDRWAKALSESSIHLNHIYPISPILQLPQRKQITVSKIMNHWIFPLSTMCDPITMRGSWVCPQLQFLSVRHMQTNTPNPLCPRSQIYRRTEAIRTNTHKHT